MITLVASPGTSLRDIGETQVVRRYGRLNKDYDALITFDPSYSPFKDKPDFVRFVGQKARRDMYLCAFLKQPLIKVGNLTGNFVSSSFLIGPRTKTRSGRPLPDLDVVELEGDNSLEAVRIIAEFYHRNGWRTYLDTTNGVEKKVVDIPTSDRKELEGVRSIEIPDLDDLRYIAKRRLGHPPNRLRFS